MGDERELASLTREEARGVMLAAQGLFDAPPSDGQATGDAQLLDLIARLGVVQIDTISVVARSQYLVLWSRLGPYDPRLLDALLYPQRAIFEYWSHAASIAPMDDYPYYRAEMVGSYGAHLYEGLRRWMQSRPEIVTQTLDAIRDRGPLASADFERAPDARRTGPWDWFGPKESRRALETLYTVGELMIHSRRNGQKVYDLRERVLAEAYGEATPRDDALPSIAERTRHFARRTLTALGALTPSWLWDYYRLGQRDWAPLFPDEKLTARTAARRLLDQFVAEGALLPARIEGVNEPAYLARERLPDLARLRSGARPTRTTLLSPFDNLIWHRARAQALFDYEVCFEAYVLPEKRRYGYYCLAILHRGRLVGRLDAKAARAEGSLLVRAVYLEPEVAEDAKDEELLEGVAGALRELAQFLGLRAVVIERSEPPALARAIQQRLKRPRTRRAPSALTP